MPHLLIERLRSAPDVLLMPCTGRDKRQNHQQKARCAVFVEVIDIIGGLTFIYGSICFMPQEGPGEVEKLKKGCVLFMVGGILYTCVSVYAILEAIEAKGWFSLEVLENVLYFVGAFVFLVGTVLYWPWEVHDDSAMLAFRAGAMTRGVSVSVYLNTFSPAFEGTVLFILGSLIFAFAAFINALNISKFNANLSSQLLTCATSSYMLGSLLFAMGSVAFLPDFGCNMSMVMLGAWMFIVGSASFEIGGMVSLVRTLRELDNPEWNETDEKTDSSL